MWASTVRDRALMGCRLLVLTLERDELFEMKALLGADGLSGYLY